jgi:hypothetical protein
MILSTDGKRRLAYYTGEMPPPAFGITAGDHTNFGWRGTFMDFFWGRGLLTQPCLFHGKMLLVALQ